MPREVEHSGSVTLISKPFYSKRMGKRVDSEMTTFFLRPYISRTTTIFLGNQIQVYVFLSDYAELKKKRKDRDTANRISQIICFISFFIFS